MSDTHVCCVHYNGLIITVITYYRGYDIRIADNCGPLVPVKRTSLSYGLAAELTASMKRKKYNVFPTLNVISSVITMALMHDSIGQIKANSVSCLEEKHPMEKVNTLSDTFGKKSRLSILGMGINRNSHNKFYNRTI